MVLYLCLPPTHPSLFTFAPTSLSFHSLIFSPTGRGLGRTAVSLYLPSPLPSQVFSPTSSLFKADKVHTAAPS